MPVQQISTFRPKCTWLAEGIRLSIQMGTACEPWSWGRTWWWPQRAWRQHCRDTLRWHRDTSCRAGFTRRFCGATGRGLCQGWTWHTCVHKCLFSRKEDVPAVEQCLCDRSCSLVRVQPNGQILWNDYAQQIFYWHQCRYGSMRNREGWRWKQSEEI